MKRLIPLLVLASIFVFSFQVQSQVIWQDDFDSYVSDSIIDPQSTQWVGWGNAVTSAYVSDDTSSSPSNSLKIWDAVVPGSSVSVSDLLHVFPNYTSGRYLLKFKVYVPTNVNGMDGATYWNIQHVVDANNTGQEWAFEVQIRNQNNPTLSSIEVGGNEYFFQAIYDEWVEVVHVFDLDNDQHDFYYNGKLITSQPFSYETGSTSGTLQLAGLDLFANCDGGSNCIELGYFDDFVFKNAPEPRNDATVLSISPDAFCPGNEDIYATIGNTGINQIHAMEIHWELNGMTMPTVYYGQLIDTANGAFPNTAQVYLGNVHLNSGTNIIKVYTENPNGTTDGFPVNDAMEVEIQSNTAPTGVNFTGIFGTSADVEVLGSTGTIDYEYGTLGFTIGAGTRVSTTSSPFTVSGLTPTTTYDLYVRNNCGGSTSAWVGPFTFKTTCLPYTAPFSESFDASSTPTCWRESGDNAWDYSTGAGYAAAPIDDHTGNSGNYAWMDGSDNSAGESSTLTSPLIDVSSLTSPLLRYWVFSYNEDDNALNKLIVDFYNGSNWHQVDSIQQNLATSWVERMIDLSSYTITGPIRIRFTVTGSMVGSTFYNDILLDDISITEAPSCFKPTALNVSSITATSADLAWTENNSATEWEIEYGTFGFTQGTGTATIVNSNPFSLAGLTQNTSYEFYVRSICGAGDSSAWVGPFNFETPCIAVNTFPYMQDFSSFVPNCWNEADNGDLTTGPSGFGSSSWTTDDFLNNTSNSQGININLYTTGKEDWVISEPFDLSGAGAQPYELRMRVGLTDYNNTSPAVMGSDDEVQLLISTDGGLTWINLYTWNVSNPPSNTGSFIRIPLSSYTGNNNVFAIWATEGTSNDPEDYDFHIDDFEIRVTPTCVEPSNLTASNLTAISADIAWAENNSATQWEIEYGISGFTLGTGADTVVSSNPFSLTGLSSATNYEYYVRSICAANDSSFWAGPYRFTTPCAAYTAPYSEDFDSAPTSFPFSGIQCWVTTGPGADDIDLVDNPDGTNIGAIPTLPNAVELNDGIFTTDTSILVSPAFSDLGSGLNRIRFQVAFENTAIDEAMYVGVMSNPAVASTFIPIDTINSTDIGGGYGFGQVIIELTNTSLYGSSQHIAFAHGNGSGNYELYLDDFRYEAIPSPSCLMPSSLSASNITTSSADFGWTENNSATEWQIEYGINGFTFGTGNRLIVNANPYSATSLSSGTDYEFFVRSICAVGDTSIWAGPYSFTTACGIFPAPFLETFSSSSIPNCWMQSAVNGGPWIFGGSTNPDFGSTHAMPDHTNGNTNEYTWVDQSGTDDTVVLTTPEIDISTLTTPALSFWIVSHNNTSSVSVFNKLYVEAFDGTNFQIIDSIQGDFGLQWKNFIYNLTPYIYNTNLVQLRFRIESGGDANDYDNDILLDDVEVKNGPSCYPPTALTVSNVTSSSADLSWTENNSSTQWEVEFGTSGFILGSGIDSLVSSNPLNVTALAGNTSYEFYVRSICGAGDTSSWAGPYGYTTDCAPLLAPTMESFDASSTPTCWIESGATSWDYSTGADYGAAIAGDHTGNNGNYAWMDGSSNSSGEVSTLTSASIDVSTLTSPMLSYWVFSNNIDDNALNKLIVEFYDGTVWHQIDSIQQNLGPNWVERMIDLTPYTITGSVQIRFTVTGSSVGSTFNNDILLDDVAIKETPSCIRPTGLSASNITATSADLLWTENNAATQWEVEYGISGFTLGTGMDSISNSNPLSLNALNSSASYEYYVRSICAAGDTSRWSGPFYFETPCAAFTAPYYNGFEAGMVNEMPVCWMDYKTDASAYVEVEDNNEYIGSQVLWLASGSADPSDTLLAISPQFSDMTAGDKRVRFHATTDYTQIELIIGTMSSPVSRVLNPIDTVTFASTYTFKEVIIDLTTANGYNGTDEYIYLQHNLASATDYVYVDEFNYEVIPSCIKPSDLTVVSITDTSADLAWTENNIATQWEVEFGTSGFIFGTGADTVVSSNPFTLTGLTPSTTYDYYVRSVCGRNDSSFWVGPFTFTTPCTPFTAPYYNGFEAGTVNEMPICWSDYKTDASTYVEVEDTYEYIGSQLMWIASGSASSSDTLLAVSPRFSDMTAGNKRIRLHASTDDTNIQLIIGTMSNPLSGVLNPIDTVSFATTYTYQEVVVPLTLANGYNGTDEYIYLQNNLATTSDYVFVDEFNYEMIPSCLKPSNLSASNITATSVDLAWTENNVATEWEIEYGNSNFILGTGVDSVVNTVPYTLNGLSSNTSYEFYVRSICGRGDTSFWSGPFSFETPCVTVTSFPYLQDFSTFVPNCWEEASNGNPSTGPSGFGSGSWLADDFLNNSANSQGANINLYTTGKEDWLISRTFDLSGAGVQPYELRMRVGLTDYNNTSPAVMGSDDEVQLLVSTDGGLTWINLYTWNTTNPPSNSSSLVTVPLSAYTGTSNIFALWATEGSTNDPEDYDFHVDDFEIREVPTCLEPTNLMASNVQTVSADIGWTENNAASQWEIEYGTAGFTLGTGTSSIVNSNPATITGLLENTTYEFYVRSICALGDSSYWTGPYAFTTLAGIPFFEDFEDFGNSEPIDIFGWNSSTSTYPQWNSGTSTPSSSTGPDADHTIGAGGIFAYLETSFPSSLGDTSGLRSPIIKVYPDFSYVELEFWYHKYGSTMGDLEVYVMSNNTNTLLTNIQGETHTSGTDAWLRHRDTLIGYEGQDIRLLFMGVAGSGITSDMAIDDVSLTPLVAVDGAITGVDQPQNKTCYTATETVSVELTNFGLDSLDFTVDSALITVNVSGAISQTLTYTVNSNSFNGGNPLLPSDSLSIPVGQVNMTDTGSYTFNISVDIASDSISFNDQYSYTIEGARVGKLVGTRQVCAGGSATLFVTDYKGSIQWQSGSGGIFTDIPGATDNSVTVNPSGNTDYRVVTCGTWYSDTLTISIPSLNAPVATDSIFTVTCGDSAIVALTANSSNPNAIFQWFQSAVGGDAIRIGGNVVDISENGDTLFYKGVPSSSTVPSTDIYYVQEIVLSGSGICSSPRDTAMAMVDCITGMKEESAGNFTNISIYPNPSKGIFQIVGEQVKEEVEISIYNTSGKLVYQSDNKLSNSFTERVDISSFAKGMYFVKLQSESSMEMKKIIVQ